jgi:hypothetical protein
MIFIIILYIQRTSKKNSKIPKIHEKITEKLAIRNPFYFSKKIHKKSHKYKL